MPGGKQFNVEEALVKAMRVFHAKGFDSASVQDLLAATGLNPGSLYATFGNKRDLYLKTLEHYGTLMAQERTRLTTQGPGRQAILQAFDDVLEKADAKEKDDFGSMYLTASIDMAPHDDDVAALVAAGFVNLTKFFEEMIERGQSRDEIISDLTPASAASVLCSQYLGMMALSRGRPQITAMRSIRAQVDAMITKRGGQPSSVGVDPGGYRAAAPIGR